MWEGAPPDYESGELEVNDTGVADDKKAVEEIEAYTKSVQPDFQDYPQYDCKLKVITYALCM